MVITINLPKPVRRLLFAWAAGKLAWKTYDKRLFNKNLTLSEAQDLFDQQYRKHMATAKEIMSKPKPKFEMSKVQFAGPAGVAAEITRR